MHIWRSQVQRHRSVKVGHKNRINVFLDKGSRKKKKSFTNGLAIKGGGGKGRAIKEKRAFFDTFFYIVAI